MKYTLGIIFLFCITAYAQTKAGLRVQYTVFCNTDIPLKYKAILRVKDNVSIYQDKASTTERWEEMPTEIEVDPKRLKSDYEPYITIDRNGKRMFFFDVIGKNIFLVKDIYTDLKWNITQEQKQIAGYNCVKATTAYRGRQWDVWYTNDIPLSFGPWKLHGLPGLILEANDSSNRFAFKIDKIEFSKGDVFEKPFVNLMAVKSTKPIDIKKFIEDQAEASENRDKVLMSKISNMNLEVKTAPRGGLELKYEWEE
ncbi:GLPGLI family protein [Flavobacterium sp. RNTU_13]|uniref:GLPGLI family protein n=1 Tax=Flavobacterium sp. RNTU_13 TaxID=3375145 RepID=UPI0039876403